MFAHPREMGEIAIAEGMVQQFAALLRAGRWRAHNVQHRDMFRIATGHSI